MGISPSLRESDLLFAELVVEQRLCSAERVSECVAALERLAASGASPIPSLGEILVQKGYLTPPQVERTLRLGKESLTTSQESAIPPEASGDRIGKYVKARKLGEGGMGEVWKAWDTELRRWVALKFLKASDAEEKARFRREAQTAAKLTHPNIGAVYEATDDYIAMQFVEGQDLSTFPRDDKRALVESLRQAALAVHFAHEQGVIHRDIKPANIMVTRRSKPPTTRRVPGMPRAPQVHAFVMDFGLAKSTAVDSRLSVSGLIVGTPSYMSPEQARGSARLDARTDVYSLGATLYEILSDRPPFRDENVYDLLKRVIEEDPRPPRAEADLRTIVMKCLEKEPARRYATAQDLADDLGRYLAGEAILAHPPSTAYRIGKWVSRRKGLVAAAVLAAAAIGVGGTVGVSQWLKARRAERARSEAAARQREGEERRRDLEVRVYPLVERAKDLARSARAMKTRKKHSVEERRGKLDEAERCCRQAMEIHPGYAPAYLVLGLVEMERGRVDDAIGAFTAAIERNPEYAQAYLERAEACTEKIFEIEHGEKAGEMPTALAEEERRLVERAKADLARGGLEEVESEERVYLELLTAWLTNGAEGISERLEALAAERRGDERIWRVAAEAAHRTRLFSLAVEGYGRYLKARPGDARAWSRRGHMRWDNKDDDGAIADYTKAIEIDPKDAEAYTNRGVARKSKGDRDGAIADYTKAIEIDPRHAEAYSNRGAAQYSKGDHGGAIADCTKAIEIDPRHAEAYSNRGAARESMGDHDGAIADCTKAIDINPRTAEAYYNRSVARISKGDHDGAIADCTKAIDINPRSVEAYCNRGIARESKADPDGAIADYTKAIEINPKYAEAYANRAHARNAKGDRDGAIADFAKALELAPPNWPYRAQVEQTLKNLRGGK